MTATIGDLDLGWVTFTTEDPRSRCAIPNPDCPREAVALAVFDDVCLHTPREVPVCAGHRDEILDAFRDVAAVPCAVCGHGVRLARMEPIR